MSYENNPFQNTIYKKEKKYKETSKNPVYAEPVKRKTIYQDVKVNKPIVMYGNSNNITQNMDYNYNNYENYNNYDNTVYTQGTEIIDNTNYNNLIYGQTQTQTYTANTTDTNNNYNYDYNYDNTVYTQNTNTNTFENYTYDTQGNTNYDYNNLIYGQTTNTTDYTDANNYKSIMFNQDIGYTDTYNNEQVYVHPVKIIDNTNTNDLYSKPYITTVEDENGDINDIIYSPETNQYENKKIEFAKTTKITNDTTNVTYEQKPKIEETNLVLNNELNNLAFDNNTVVLPPIITNSNTQVNHEITNNIETNAPITQPTQIIQPNINLNNQNNQNNQQTEKKDVVREISKYEKVAQVRKIIEDDVPDDTAYNINNNNKVNENKKTNNKIKPKVYDANMQIQHVNQIAKIELSPEEERQANPMYKTMEMQQSNNMDISNNINNINNVNQINHNIEVKENLNNNSNNIININENLNNRTYNNSYRANEVKTKNVNMVTPIRRPVDDYRSKARTPLNRGFHKVRIIKKSPEIKQSFFRNDLLDKNYTYNNIRHSNNNKKINVVKLNDNNFNSKNVQYNNYKKIRNSNSSDKKRMSNDSDDNFNNMRNPNSIEKRNEDFNNISEIKYEQNNSTDNEQIRREKDNLNFKKREIDFDDDYDNKKSGKNQYKAVIKKIDDDWDNDIKSSNINKKSEISESTKRIKNNDGLDEFDNNFNNHDLFYNKMKNLFDD
jgi:hypothetical protein